MNDEKVLKQLDLLLQFTTPASIKESVTEIFFRFLMDNHSLLPTDFETIIGDIYFLLEFIKSIEEEVVKD